MSAPGDKLLCADCGRAIPWRSDEAGEWPVVTDAGSFKTICVDCYGRRYGTDKADHLSWAIHLDQADERISAPVDASDT